MRVLGVDPGLTRCGLGVVEGSVGRPLHLIDVGVVRTAADLPVPRRLCLVEDEVNDWLTQYRPDAVAVERVFSQHNLRTVMGTAQASGVVMVAAARRGLPVGLHTPSEVKAAVSGSGRADKAQIAAMVTRLLRLDVAPTPADAADALALAICHIWRAAAQARIERAVLQSRAQAAEVQEPVVIAFVSGRVAALTLTSAVVDVGGVGLELSCTPGTLATLSVGARAMLPSSMVVREESLTLFGFLDEDERSVFELLQTASGVGPKLAQAMLAVHTPNQLRRAVMGEDVRALTRVPGIGQKGAQRIILELKDRIGPPAADAAAGASVPRVTSGSAGWREQVSAGLVGLGWSAREADQAVEQVAEEVAEDAGDAPDVGAMLRAALRSLGRP